MIELESVMLSEISQTERQILYDFTYMEVKEKNNKINERQNSEIQRTNW